MGRHLHEHGLPRVIQDGTYSYVYGLDLISMTDGSGNQHYFSYDGLGSLSDLTDGTGAVTDTFAYDVFGAVTTRTGTTPNVWKFTGEQADDGTGDSGYYYLRARHYDPSTGRFVGRDKVEFSQRYAYTGNNPGLMTDPAGTWPGQSALKLINYLSGCLNLNPFGPSECQNDASQAEAARSVLSRYGDFNVTGCFGLCLTLGMMFSQADGIHDYYGGGFGTPQLGASLSAAPGQSITRGWNCGIQVSGTTPVGIGVTGQFGLGGGGSGEEASYFAEGGVGGGVPVPLAAAGTCFWVR